jgi:hypothetical protein
MPTTKNDNITTDQGGRDRGTETRTARMTAEGHRKPAQLGSQTRSPASS